MNQLSVAAASTLRLQLLVDLVTFIAWPYPWVRMREHRSWRNCTLWRILGTEMRRISTHH